MRDLVIQLVDELLDAQRNRSQLDIIDDFAHPLPVRVISKMLGVPIQDKARFEVWVSALVITVATQVSGLFILYQYLRSCEVK
ncbi:MAG: hypothetical protein WCC17_09010 [Candidatus Nitrosopolaris sp.]|jgi:cytochrome P450